jgi:hypothetical protein
MVRESALSCAVSLVLSLLCAEWIRRSDRNDDALYVGSGQSKASASTLTGAAIISGLGDSVGQGQTYSFPTVTYNGLIFGFPKYPTTSRSASRP